MSFVYNARLGRVGKESGQRIANPHSFSTRIRIVVVGEKIISMEQAEWWVGPESDGF